MENQECGSKPRWAASNRKIGKFYTGEIMINENNITVIGL